MSCPMCAKDSDTKYRPFCSKRCADLDLSKWLTGSYAIASAQEDDDETLSDALRQEQDKPH